MKWEMNRQMVTWLLIGLPLLVIVRIFGWAGLWEQWPLVLLFVVPAALYACFPSIRAAIPLKVRDKLREVIDWLMIGVAVAFGVLLAGAFLYEYGSAALAIALGIPWALLGWAQDAWSNLTKLENLPGVFLVTVLLLVFWIRGLCRALHGQLADIRTLLWSISESQKRDQ